MARTMIDIDEKLLKLAAEELGTTSKKDTVNEALREVGARAARRRVLERMKAGAYDQLADADFEGRAWG